MDYSNSNNMNHNSHQHLQDAVTNWESAYRQLASRCQEGLGIGRDEMLSRLGIMQASFDSVIHSYQESERFTSTFHEQLESKDAELIAITTQLQQSQLEHLSAQERLQSELDRVHTEWKSAMQLVESRQREHEREREKLLEMIERSQRVSAELDAGLNSVKRERQSEIETLRVSSEEREVKLREELEGRMKLLTSEAERMRKELDSLKLNTEDREGLLHQSRSELLLELKRIRDLMHEKDLTAQQEKKALDMEYERCRRFVADKQRLFDEMKKNLSLEMDLALADLRDQVSQRDDELSELKRDISEYENRFGQLAGTGSSSTTGDSSSSSSSSNPNNNSNNNNSTNSTNSSSTTTANFSAPRSLESLYAEIDALREQLRVQEEREHLAEQERDRVYQDVERRSRFVEQREDQTQKRDEQRLREHERELNDVKERALQLESEKKVILAQLSEVHNLLRDREQEIYEQVQSIQSLYEKVLDASESAAQLWSQHRDALSQDHEKFRRQFDQFETTLSAERQLHRQELERFQKLLAEKENRLSQVDQILRENDAFRQEVNRLQFISEERRADLDKLRMDLRDRVERHGDTLYEAVNTLEQIRSEKQRQSERYESELRTLQAMTDETRRQLSAGVEEMDRVRSSWSREMGTLKSQLTLSESGSSKKVEESRIIYERKIQSLSEQNRILLSQHEQSSARLRDREREFATEIRSLQEQVASSRDNEQKLRDGLEELANAWKEQESILQSELIHHQQTAEQLGGKLEVIQQAHDRLKAENEQLSVQQMRRSVDEKTLQVTEQHRQRWQAECERARGELEVRDRDFARERDIVNAELSSLRNSRDELARQHKETETLLQRENERLTIELQGVRQRMSDSEAILKARESELSAEIQLVLAGKERVMRLEAEKNEFLTRERERVREQAEREQAALSIREKTLMSEVEALRAHIRLLEQDQVRQREVLLGQIDRTSKAVQHLEETLAQRTDVVRKEMMVYMKTLDSTDKMKHDLEAGYQKQIRDLKNELQALRIAANNRHRLFSEEKKALKSEVDKLLKVEQAQREDNERRWKKKYGQTKKQLEGQLREVSEECKRLRFSVVRLSNQEIDRDKSHTAEVQQLQEALSILRKMEDERVQQYQSEKRLANELIRKLADQLQAQSSSSQPSSNILNNNNNNSTNNNIGGIGILSNSSTPFGFSSPNYNNNNINSNISTPIRSNILSSPPPPSSSSSTSNSFSAFNPLHAANFNLNLNSPSPSSSTFGLNSLSISD